jgi:hypothetical protein
MKGGKEVNMKNTLLVLALAFGIFVFCASGVFADQSQNTTTNVTQYISFQISPSLLDFGSIQPGQTSSPLGVSADATHSNINLSITVAVSGFPFQTGLYFDDVLANTHSFKMPCVINNSICTYNTVGLSATLAIPQGTPAQQFNGVITYTVEEDM